MATIDEFVLKNIGLWWRYRISRHCDEWKYIIIGRIFESEIILIPPSLKISESSSNGSYRNTDEVWWRYGLSRSCDECSKGMTAITSLDFQNVYNIFTWFISRKDFSKNNTVNIFSFINFTNKIIATLEVIIIWWNLRLLFCNNQMYTYWNEEFSNLYCARIPIILTGCWLLK